MILTREQLHEALVTEGTVTEDQFARASEKKEVAEIGIGEVLVSQGILTDDQYGQLLSLWYRVPFVNLDQKHIEPEVLQILPESFARTHELIPLSVTDQEVVIATSDPNDVIERSLLEKYLRKTVHFSFATSANLKNHMYLFQKDPKTLFEEILNKKTALNAVDTTVMELVNGIFDHAFQSGASDIHIEPEEKYTIIRYRQDGVLHDIAQLPVSVHEHIMTRLKVLARLATDEHRIAQDGRIRYKTPWGEQLDVRLSLVPTTQAEKAVMRLLTDHLQSFSLNDLGLSTEDFKKVSEAIHKPWGMFLITGPTGSGKSTTLYSILKILNQREVNITTIEDPVEYQVDGVNQIQVNEKTGLTFASGLRSIVRQDPDIIMVGEIRDKETASISINAAMTGHLLLSTLHTNDAATAFPRLLDMDVDDFLVSSTTNLVIAQRLVRKICVNCIQSSAMDAVSLHFLETIPQLTTDLKKLSGVDDPHALRVFKGNGCHLCHGSGYRGRIGIFEVLTVTDTIKEAIVGHKHSDEIRTIAMNEGMTSMVYDGLRKVLNGQTTMEEVFRVTRE